MQGLLSSLSFSETPPPPPATRRSTRVSLEYFPEDVERNLSELLPAKHPPLWSHRWIKSYHDDHLLYASIWDAKSAAARKAVVVFAHATCVHSHFYDAQLLRPLARAGFAVMAYDRRGHGRTGRANVSTSLAFGNIGDEHHARLTDLAAVVDAAQHAFPDLPVLLAGHGLGAAECLAFCARWSKSSQARCVKGLLAFSPGYGELKFWLDVQKVRSILAPVYPALILAGAVSAESLADSSTVHLAVAAARKLFRRYCDIRTGMIDEAMLERCLNATLKLDLENAEIHKLFTVMDPDGPALKIDVEELVMAVAVVGAPDDFCCASCLAVASPVKPFLDRAMTARGGDVKPPVFWCHGTGDKVNSPTWAEEVVRSCGGLDAEVKLHPELTFGVFMDEDASLVVKEAIDWMDRVLAEERGDGEGNREAAAAAGGDADDPNSSTWSLMSGVLG